MTQEGLDAATDPVIESLAALAKATVNSSLQNALGVDAIKNVFQAPLPLSLLTMGSLPALCIYRLEDRDLDLGDHIFNDETTFRFDYYAPATPLSRLDKRWHVLRGVWVALLAGIRHGRHTDAAGGQDLGIGRYVLGSGRNTYTFVPGAEQTYPAFRGQVKIEGCYDPTFKWDTSPITPFERVWTDWDVQDANNLELEAKNKLNLDQ